MSDNASRSPRLVMAWARLYTNGLPDDEGERRRLEIESDLWEQRHDHTEHHSRRAVVGRWLRGIPADLWWRYRTLANAGRSSRTAQGRTHNHGWWFFATALLGVANIVLSIGASVFSNGDVVIGPIIGATTGTIAGGLIFAGLFMRTRNLVTGSWIVAAGCLAGLDPLLLPLVAVVLIGGVWNADLQFNDTPDAAPKLVVARRQQSSMTRRWYLWLGAAPVLFGFGLLFPLFVYNDTTEAGDDYPEGILAVVDGVMWMAWWGSWLASAVCLAVGVVLGALALLVHHRSQPVTQV